MLVRGLEIVQDAYAKYTADGVAQLLLICAITVLLIKEKKSEDRLLALYTIVLVIVVCLPPIAYIISKFTGASVYWRVFWLVPSVIIIAMVATKIIEQMNKKTKQGIVFLAVLFVIILGGRMIYRSDNFTKSTNPYKLPQEAIDICEMVAPDGGVTKMVVPETIVSYIRQYNPNIELYYGRNMGKDYQRGRKFKVLLQLNSQDPDYEYIAKYTKKNNCVFVVFENTTNNLESMEEYGYQLFGSTTNYTIFKLNE